MAAFFSQNAWVIPASVASASLVASLGMGTMGAYTASITNDQNTAGAGSLVMTEVAMDGSGTACSSTDGANNAAVCSSINKYGGDLNMLPGQSTITEFALRNDGTVPATSFTLSAGDCTETGTGAACDAMIIQISDGATLIYEGTAAELAQQTFTLQAPVEPEAERPFTVTATVPDSVVNELQGGAISQPLTWTFTA